ILDDSIAKRSGTADKTVNSLSGNKLYILTKLLFTSNYKVIHYHSGNWYVRYLLTIIGKIRKSKVLFTIHSFRDDVKSFEYIKRKIMSFSIENGSHFIAVGKKEQDKLIENGCNKSKITVIPAFI